MGRRKVSITGIPRGWDPEPPEYIPYDKGVEGIEFWIEGNPIVRQHGRALYMRFVNDRLLARMLGDLMHDLEVDVTAILIVLEPAGFNTVTGNYAPGYAIVCISEPKGEAQGRPGPSIGVKGIL